jgi:hypothetical protein
MVFHLSVLCNENLTRSIYPSYVLLFIRDTGRGITLKYGWIAPGGWPHPQAMATPSTATLADRAAIPDFPPFLGVDIVGEAPL